MLCACVTKGDSYMMHALWWAPLFTGRNEGGDDGVESVGKHIAENRLLQCSWCCVNHIQLSCCGDKFIVLPVYCDCASSALSTRLALQIPIMFRWEDHIFPAVWHVCHTLSVCILPSLSGYCVLLFCITSIYPCVVVYTCCGDGLSFNTWIRNMVLEWVWPYCYCVLIKVACLSEQWWSCCGNMSLLSYVVALDLNCHVRVHDMAGITMYCSGSCGLNSSRKCISCLWWRVGGRSCLNGSSGCAEMLYISVSF